MKLFACSISAQSSSAAISAPVYARAHTQEEATGLALGYAKEQWPYPTYYHHQAAVIEIPAAYIAETQALP